MGSSIVWALLIVFFVLMFKKHIESILSNGAKAKIKYKNIDIDLGNSDSSFLGQKTQNSVHTELKNAFKNIIVTNNEKNIRVKLIEAQVNKDDALELLINHLANTQFNIAILIVDKLIYEEQTELLYYLNDKFSSELQNNLLCFFYKWQKKESNKSHTFMNFMNFLLEKNLVIQDMFGYKISILGKEYLNFLIRYGRPIPGNPSSTPDTTNSPQDNP